MSFWVAGGVVVAGVGSAVIGSKATSKAGRAAADASDRAIASSERQFDQIRADTAGLRFTGNAALDRINRLYGYGPGPKMQVGPTAARTPFQTTLPAATVPGGSLNIGGQLTQKLGGLGKILDPAASIFGSKKGDERRNIKAFLADNEITDLGNGMLALADGRTFSKDQLQHVAGTYYGARYHPDGDQAGWQAKYDAALSPAPAAPEQSSEAAAPSGPDMSVFFESPDYQFRLSETQKALDRAGSARGRFASGAALKEGSRYVSGLAAGEYASFYDRLAQQAGLGVTGIGQSAAAGMANASNVGNAAIFGGNARANSYMTNAGIWNSALQGTAGNLALLKYLNQAPGG